MLLFRHDVDSRKSLACVAVCSGSSCRNTCSSLDERGELRTLICASPAIQVVRTHPPALLREPLPERPLPTACSRLFPVWSCPAHGALALTLPGFTGVPAAATLGWYPCLHLLLLGPFLSGTWSCSSRDEVGGRLARPRRLTAGGCCPSGTRGGLQGPALCLPLSSWSSGILEEEPEYPVPMLHLLLCPWPQPGMYLSQSTLQNSVEPSLVLLFCNRLSHTAAEKSTLDVSVSSVVQIPAASPLRRSCPVDIKGSQRHRSYVGSGSSPKVWLVAGFQAPQCGALILSLPWWDPLSSSLRFWRPPLGGQGASASCSLGLYNRQRKLLSRARVVMSCDSRVSGMRGPCPPRLSSASCCDLDLYSLEFSGERKLKHILTFVRAEWPQKLLEVD